MGDLNLDADDPKRNSNKKKLEALCVERTKVLQEVTTTRYNQLDHILLNIGKFPVFYSTSFFNHTTDHHTIIARIAKSGNNKKQSFLKRVSFDADEYTKSKRRKISNLEGKKDEENIRKLKRKNVQDDIEVKFTKKARKPEIMRIKITILRNLQH